ncbi:MAG: hypothetical protein M1830_004601 [Pleopsidium flavum]|nr:MAG: hypothetical protein M1830_004601 [Pleopsidium flavum]
MKRSHRPASRSPTTQPLTPPPLKRPRLHPIHQQPRRDPSVPGPAPDHLRIYSWNINGIAPFLQRPITSFFTNNKSPDPSDDVSEKKADLRACLRRWEWPEIVCLQEVKIGAGDEGTKRAVERAVNTRRPKNANVNVRRRRRDDDESEEEDDDGGPAYTVHFNLPHDPHNARGFGGRVYGVATLIRSDIFAAEVRAVGEVDWDIEGRVLVTDLENAGLVLMNVYAVNGTDNPWRDPRSGVVLGTRHDRKLQFHEGLLREWRRWEEEEGRGVVVVGDLNVARGEVDGWPGVRKGERHVRSRRDFEGKFFGGEGVGAVDTFREVHGGERRYSYFPRGRVWGESCDRVDLGMVSRGLVNGGRLVGADILDEVGERGPSDHVPLYVTLKLEKDNGTVP